MNQTTASSTAATIASDAFALDPADREAILVERAHYPYPQAASIEALKIVQRRHGWVPDAAIPAIAETLGIRIADVEGVATFYSLIFRQPVGRHVILICDSSSCFLTDYEELRDAFSAHLGIQMGQTTADGRFTLLPVCCLGACDRGPTILIGEDLHGPVTPDEIPRLLEAYS